MSEKGPFHSNDAVIQFPNECKDETIVSNIAMAHLSVHDLDIVQTESFGSTKPNTGAIDIRKEELVEFEEKSFHSCRLANDDRYAAFGAMDVPRKEPSLPGIIDVSTIADMEPDFQKTMTFDNDGEFNLTVQSEYELEIPELTEWKVKPAFKSDDDISDVKSQQTSEGSTEASSLLLNVWNEDYDGNPDPEMMKKLIAVKHLPKGIDPFVAYQINREKFLTELRVLEDDDSSHGSCHVFLRKHCLGKIICGLDDESDDDDDDDSIVDTVIVVNDKSDEESNDSLFLEDLNFKRPKTSKYALVPDNQYHPGLELANQELVLMLPKSSTWNGERKKIENPFLPVQHVVQIEDEEDTCDEDVIDVGYVEKEMEFTLQKYDSTPQRIAELVLQGKVSEHPTYSKEDLKRAHEEHSMKRDGVSVLIDLNDFVIKDRMIPEDDDLVEADRSVVSAIEATKHKLAILLQRGRKECYLQESNQDDSCPDQPEEYIPVPNEEIVLATLVPAGEHGAVLMIRGKIHPPSPENIQKALDLSRFEGDKATEDADSVKENVPPTNASNIFDNRRLIYSYNEIHHSLDAVSSTAPILETQSCSELMGEVIESPTDVSDTFDLKERSNILDKSQHIFKKKFIENEDEMPRIVLTKMKRRGTNQCKLLDCSESIYIKGKLCTQQTNSEDNNSDNVNSEKRNCHDDMKDHLEASDTITVCLSSPVSTEIDSASSVSLQQTFSNISRVTSCATIDSAPKSNSQEKCPTVVDKRIVFNKKQVRKEVDNHTQKYPLSSGNVLMCNTSDITTLMDSLDKQKIMDEDSQDSTLHASIDYKAKSCVKDGEEGVLEIISGFGEESRVGPSATLIEQEAIDNRVKYTTKDMLERLTPGDKSKNIKISDPLIEKNISGKESQCLLGKNDDEVKGYHLSSGDSFNHDPIVRRCTMELKVPHVDKLATTKAFSSCDTYSLSVNRLLMMGLKTMNDAETKSSVEGVPFKGRDFLKILKVRGDGRRQNGEKGGETGPPSSVSLNQFEDISQLLDTSCENNANNYSMQSMDMAKILEVTFDENSSISSHLALPTISFKKNIKKNWAKFDSRSMKYSAKTYYPSDKVSAVSYERPNNSHTNESFKTKEYSVVSSEQEAINKDLSLLKVAMSKSRVNDDRTENIPINNPSIKKDASSVISTERNSIDSNFSLLQQAWLKRQPKRMNTKFSSVAMKKSVHYRSYN